MKYFTRDLYRLSGRDEFPPQLWDALLREYENHRHKVMSRMPPQCRQVARLNLHDAVLSRVSFTGPTTLILTVEGSRHILDSKKRIQGVHILEFFGVTDADIAISAVGQEWGYQEVDFDGERAVLRVLLEEDEFEVRFNRIRIKTEPNDGPHVIARNARKT